MNWLIIAEILYVCILLLICLRVIYDTHSTTKTLAYLLLIIFLPVIGIFIYFSFGINYRRRKIYSKKLIRDIELEQQVRQRILSHSMQAFSEGEAPVKNNSRMFHLLLSESSSLTNNNKVELLINGEEKFPLVLEKLRQAKNHIHIEYYIYENDTIGNAIADILIEKAKEGVEVRFIYDDFGSRAIRKKLVPRMRAAGVQAFPFHKITFMALANRLNYRNHRKIIVIDGSTAFVGGINVCDKYINSPGLNNKLFWRDTHIMIRGFAVYQLQYLFLTDWNFCAGDSLQPNEFFFPGAGAFPAAENKAVQIAASGPDSNNPTIEYALFQAITSARKELLITTPYFIPSESILEAMIVAAYSGISVKLLVPGISDSFFVNTASSAYYGELLKAGVEVYRYKKGFVHAKTLVCDRSLSIVGTANMDHRSFDLNFEVCAIVYDEAIATDLAGEFEKDMAVSERIDPTQWLNRPMRVQFFEKICRLVSPLL